MPVNPLIHHNSLLLLMLLLAPAIQAGAEMNEEQMQQMMQQARQMQECLARVDQGELEALGVRAESMAHEVEALCAAGQRDQAQQLAIQYGQDISRADIMQDLKQCGDMATGMLQQMPGLAVDQPGDDSLHVCDAPN